MDYFTLHLSGISWCRSCVRSVRVESFMGAEETLMQEWMPRLIFLAGAGQLGVLIASALVPFQLQWKTELAVLSRLHRQMYWVYGGYVVLAIAAFGLISLFNAGELAN